MCCYWKCTFILCVWNLKKKVEDILLVKKNIQIISWEFLKFLFEKLDEDYSKQNYVYTVTENALFFRLCEMQICCYLKN